MFKNVCLVISLFCKNLYLKTLHLVMRYCFFLFFNVLTCTLFAQDAVSTNKGKLTLKYFKIEREQIDGSYDTRLSTHFQYLKLFKKGQRFAPDEPSSIASLEFTFLDKKLNSKFSMEWSAGIYRNHIKGDLILDSQNEVHFGLGNSQVGISSTAMVNHQFWKSMQLSYFLQLGVGPHFTRWQNGDNKITPEGWGIRGAGATINTGLQLTSPTFWNRWSISGYVLFNLTYSRYRDIVYETAFIRPVYFYEEIYFTLKNKNVVAGLGLSFDILKNNANQ